LRKKLLVALVLTAVTLVAVVFAGAASSGAMLLMLPSAGHRRHQDLPRSYRPLHKGYVDHSTGFYTRENDDLVVRSTPPSSCGARIDRATASRGSSASAPRIRAKCGFAAMARSSSGRS
jgi:hypothetical protein